MSTFFSLPIEKQMDELQLTPEVIYSLTTDGIPITVICGTTNGRIFLGGKDGSLFELVYQVSCM